MKNSELVHWIATGSLIVIAGYTLGMMVEVSL